MDGIKDNQFLMVANSTQNNEMKQRSLQRLVDIEENFHQVSNSPPKKISPTHFQPNLSTVQHNLNLLEKSVQTVSLEELIETYPKILNGEISGRVLVDLNK